jgi:hypothetical protein
MIAVRHQSTPARRDAFSSSVSLAMRAAVSEDMVSRSQGQRIQGGWYEETVSILKRLSFPERTGGIDFCIRLATQSPQARCFVRYYRESTRRSHHGGHLRRLPRPGCNHVGLFSDGREFDWISADTAPASGVPDSACLHRAAAGGALDWSSAERGGDTGFNPGGKHGDIPRTAGTRPSTMPQRLGCSSQRRPEQTSRTTHEWPRLPQAPRISPCGTAPKMSPFHRLSTRLIGPCSRCQRWTRHRSQRVTVIVYKTHHGRALLSVSPRL